MKGDKTIERTLSTNNIYGFIYKITNMLNSKIYVGQHMGIDFGEYWGSGVLLSRAYKKYGKDAFKRAGKRAGGVINGTTFFISRREY